MNNARYNTKEGILTMLRTLESFHELIRIRKEASMERGENLEDFFLLGRFLIHSSGDVIKWTPDFFSPEMYATIPPVLTPKEFIALTLTYAVNTHIVRHGQEEHLPAIPPAHLVDPINGQGWTIHTCHDAYPIETDMDMDLDDYIGKTIRELKELLNSQKDKIYIFNPLRIFNIELVDADDDESKHARHDLHEPGLRPQKDLNDNYIVQWGDMIYVRIVQFFHKNTYQAHLTQEQDTRINRMEKSMETLCESGGFHDVCATLQPLPDHVINYHGGPNPSYLSLSATEYIRVRTLEGSFGAIVIENGFIYFDLEGTDVSAHDLCDAADLLVDREKTHPNFCMISEKIFETLYKKMSSH